LTAVYISARNAESVCGLPWRRVLGFAQARGLPIVRLGKALLVPVSELQQALRTSPQVSTETAPEPLGDAAAAIRAALGLRKRVTP
jgi:hypothetical protein